MFCGWRFVPSPEAVLFRAVRRNQEPAGGQRCGWPHGTASQGSPQCVVPSPCTEAFLKDTVDKQCHRRVDWGALRLGGRVIAKVDAADDGAGEWCRRGSAGASHRQALRLRI